MRRPRFDVNDRRRPCAPLRRQRFCLCARVAFVWSRLQQTRPLLELDSYRTKRSLFHVHRPLCHSFPDRPRTPDHHRTAGRACQWVPGPSICASNIRNIRWQHSAHQWGRRHIHHRGRYCEPIRHLFHIHRDLPYSATQPRPLHGNRYSQQLDLQSTHRLLCRHRRLNGPDNPLLPGPGRNQRHTQHREWPQRPGLWHSRRGHRRRAAR